MGVASIFYLYLKKILASSLLSFIKVKGNTIDKEYI